MADEIILGAQLYTVREYMKTREDFRATMKRIADIGYKYVQVSGAADAPADVIKTAAEETGLSVIITHSPASRILNDTERLIEEHLSYGAKAIGLGSMGYEHSADGYKKFCEDFMPAAEKIKAAGLRFCYHNHRFEFEQYGGKTGLELILENSSDALMLTFDTYWAQAGGCDPAKFIAEHGGRIFCTHLKDMTVINDAIAMTEVGDGNMNFDGIIAASKAVGLKYHFVEQDVVRINAFDSMKRSFDNLKGYFK